MKIYKVLVDELPETCSKCDLYDSEEYMCRATFKDIYECLDYPKTNRPVWCPLVIPDSVIFFHGKQFYKVQI